MTIMPGSSAMLTQVRNAARSSPRCSMGLLRRLEDLQREYQNRRVWSAWQAFKETTQW